MNHVKKSKTLNLLMPVNSKYFNLTEVLKNEYEALKEATEEAEKISKNWLVPGFFLTDQHKRVPYRRKILEVRPQIHIGQLKLFLCELWFLNNYQHLCNTVVYVGTGKGKHIGFLAKLFPHLTFHLYDPREFHLSLYERPNIVLYTKENGYFTQEIANQWINKPILFISDIRTGDPLDAACDFNKCVNRDMKDQMSWVITVKPLKSMLKFRLPYSPGKTHYFDGLLKFGIFATKSSTEFRLIVDQHYTFKDYDHQTIEEQCYHFNNHIRATKIYPIVPYQFGDYCWDCTAMKYVCLDFLGCKYLNESTTFVHEELFYILNHSFGLLNETCNNLICEYVSFHQDILENFMNDVVYYCGSKVLKKLNTHPHGDQNPQQWIDRRNNYHNYDAFTKKSGTKPFKYANHVPMMRKLYNEVPKLWTVPLRQRKL